MIKTILADVLAEKIDPGDDKRIYLIRDGNFAIYVGQALYVCERITDHCGLGPRLFQADRLGNFILSNHPASLRWEVDLLTLGECELTARQYFPSYSSFDIDAIEKALILAFSPCLNTIHNNENLASAIPEKYQISNTKKITKSWSLSDFYVTHTDLKIKSDKLLYDEVFKDELVRQNAFLQYKQGLAKSTIRNISRTQTQFREYISQLNGNALDSKENLNFEDDPKAWRNITAHIITGFIQWLIAKGYAINTINVRISFIKKYAEIAYQVGEISKDEWKKISKIRKIHRGKAKKINIERSQNSIPTQLLSRMSITITDQQAKALKSFPENDPKGRRSNIIMCLLLDQGLRAKEIPDLRVEDFNLDEGYFNLERANFGLQRQTLTADTINALECLFENKDIRKTGPLGTRVGANGRVNQKPISLSDLRYYVHIAGKDIGIDGLSTKHCRSYWIQKELDAGKSILELQEAGGWTGIQSVIRNIKQSEKE